MLFLAMSCLQGRTQDAAFEVLRALEPDGIQLTPGNLPSGGFRSALERSGFAVRFHHGFAWDAYRRPVHDDGQRLVLGRSEYSGSLSVHPPSSTAGLFAEWLAHAVQDDVIIEAMYPGYHMGDGEELSAAMEARLMLAVDISHVHIQRTRGLLDDETLKRLLEYDRIAEIHISQNDGRADQHRPVTEDAPLLGWALDRARAGVPAVYESYFHRLSDGERQRQVERVRV